ncbi:hypothetical protein [Streptomyces sp. NPDC051577]|uniref:hypothetical protein n=1 Tax=Streptomyces sp. NPDC051577 TaxID=3155166 RepID=UPI00342EBDEE
MILLLLVGLWCVTRFPADARPGGVWRELGTSVTIAFGADAQAHALAIQPNGLVVTAGGAGGQLALARQRSDGQLDVRFGGNGTVKVQFGAESMANSLVLQPDGKVIAAGYTGDGAGSTKFALARFNPDGTLDDTFGQAGKTTTHFGKSPDQANDQANSLVLQPDGKVIAAGYTSSGRSTVFALARFRSDGTLDHGFGHTGKTTTDFGNFYDQANSLVLQPDGKVIAAGYTSATRTTALALARYTADGRADKTFGTNGRLVSASDSHTFALQAVFHSDGTLIVAGFVYGPDNTDFAVTRYAKDDLTPGMRWEVPPHMNRTSGSPRPTDQAYPCAPRRWHDSQRPMTRPVLFSRPWDCWGVEMGL